MTEKQEQNFNELEQTCMTGGIARYRTRHGYCACSYETDFREASKKMIHKKCLFAHDKLERIIVEWHKSNKVPSGINVKTEVYAYKCLVYPHFENDREDFKKNEAN